MRVVGHARRIALGEHLAGRVPSGEQRSEPLELRRDRLAAHQLELVDRIGPGGDADGVASAEERIRRRFEFSGAAVPLEVAFAEGGGARGPKVLAGGDQILVEAPFLDVQPVPDHPEGQSGDADDGQQDGNYWGHEQGIAAQRGQPLPYLASAAFWRSTPDSEQIVESQASTSAASS